MDEWIAGFARQGWHDQLAVLLQVAYAMLLGGAIGVEREIKNRPAGFRTHMLVAGAAALLVGLGDLLANHYVARTGHDILRLDAMRLISAVVSAVGFLGAGAIFRRGGDGFFDFAERNCARWAGRLNLFERGFRGNTFGLIWRETLENTIALRAL